MKKQLLNLLASGMLMLTANAAFSQTPYITEMYTFSKVSNVLYDSNRSVNLLPSPAIIGANLRCDIYTPNNATTNRPLVIVAHTGSFLPVLLNQQATGNKDDSAMVELCTRLAKRGFVAVAMNYRLGWNPATTDAGIATQQLLQATYRGIQDMRNCVRYMRTNAGTYSIDTSKIIIGGQGTGGYIAQAFGTIDKRAEIEDLLKFQIGTTNMRPMVNVDTLGDWHGLGGLPMFNVAGESNVSSEAHMVFNYGGAMGDLSWLEANSLPIVSLQVVSDPFAPYNTGNVIVPTTGNTVISNASGAGVVIPKANMLGVNAKINAKYLLDVYSKSGYQKSGGQNNVYPFYPKVSLDGAPWEFWDTASVRAKTFTNFYTQPLPASGRSADSISRLTNPLMSVAKGKAYIDTIINFLVPRIAVQFDLVASTLDTLAASYNLLTPANNTRVLVKGDSSQAINVTWNPANKTGFGNMTYTWKLSKASTVNFAAPVGSVTSVGKPMTKIDYTTISGFMANAGIAIADSADFKWTIQADLNGTKLWASDTFSIKLIRGQVSAVKEIANLSQYLSVYPNPTSDVLNINIDSKAGAVSAYRLMDVTGRTVLNANAESNVFSVNVNGVTPGLYFMNVTLKDGSVATKRVVIK